MQASSPTGVCCNAGPRFPGWPRYSPSSVGADSISARGFCAAAGFPGRYGIGPYRGLRYRRRRGFPVGTGLPLIVGAGFIPPAALRRRRVRGTISGLRAGPAARLASETRLRAQCEHRPLQGLPYRSPRCSRHSGPAFAPPHGPFKILFSYAVRVLAGGFVLPGSARQVGGISWGRARGGQCARTVPKQDALPRAPQIYPPVRPLPGDAAAPRRYNGGKPGTPCVSQRGGYPLYQ